MNTSATRDHSVVYKLEEFICALHSDLHLLHALGENTAEMHWILSTWGGIEEKELMKGIQAQAEIKFCLAAQKLRKIEHLCQF